MSIITDIEYLGTKGKKGKLSLLLSDSTRHEVTFNRKDIPDKMTEFFKMNLVRILKYIFHDEQLTGDDIFGDGSSELEDNQRLSNFFDKINRDPQYKKIKLYFDSVVSATSGEEFILRIKQLTSENREYMEKILIIIGRFTERGNSSYLNIDKAIDELQSLFKSNGKYDIEGYRVDSPSKFTGAKDEVSMPPLLSDSSDSSDPFEGGSSGPSPVLFTSPEEQAMLGSKRIDDKVLMLLDNKGKLDLYESVYHYLMKLDNIDHIIKFYEIFNIIEIDILPTILSILKGNDKSIFQNFLVRFKELFPGIDPGTGIVRDYKNVYNKNGDPATVKQFLRCYHQIIKQMDESIEACDVAERERVAAEEAERVRIAAEDAERVRVAAENERESKQVRAPPAVIRLSSSSSEDEGGDPHESQRKRSFTRRVGPMEMEMLTGDLGNMSLGGGPDSGVDAPAVQMLGAQDAQTEMGRRRQEQRGESQEEVASPQLGNLDFGDISPVRGARSSSFMSPDRGGGGDFGSGGDQESPDIQLYTGTTRSRSPGAGRLKYTRKKNRKRKTRRKRTNRRRSRTTRRKRTKRRRRTTRRRSISRRTRRKRRTRRRSINNKIEQVGGIDPLCLSCVAGPSLLSMLGYGAAVGGGAVAGKKIYSKYKSNKSSSSIKRVGNKLDIKRSEEYEMNNNGKKEKLNIKQNNNVLDINGKKKKYKSLKKTSEMYEKKIKSCLQKGFKKCVK